MNIAIRSTETQKAELIQKGFGANIRVLWVEADQSLQNIPADAYFDLVFDDTVIDNNEFIAHKPVFVHAVNCTCTEIAKDSYIRLNAWNGFLNRGVTELACKDETTKKQAVAIFNALQWKFVWVNDDHGLISARIISMIINEAYYALEDGVSTKEQIDIAMKLGTNYPYGPFEWSRKIGLAQVRNLLQQLQKQDGRYTISGLLVQESQQI